MEIKVVEVQLGMDVCTYGCSSYSIWIYITTDMVSTSMRQFSRVALRRNKDEGVGKRELRWGGRGRGSKRRNKITGTCDTRVVVANLCKLLLRYILCTKDESSSSFYITIVPRFYSGYRISHCTGLMYLFFLLLLLIDLWYALSWRDVFSVSGVTSTKWKRHRDSSC